MSTLTRKQRRDAARGVETQALIDGLAERVHSGTTRLTCFACGTSSYIDKTRQTIERDGLDGSTLVYGLCDPCRRRGRGLERVVFADRLGVDPGSEVLAYTQVPRFGDVLGARPDRPNTEAWGHVTDRELAELIDGARRDLAAASDTACAMCGDTRRISDHGRTSQGWCQNCEWHLERAFEFATGQRDYVANWLIGGFEQEAPRGLGERVGIRWYHELTPDEQEQAGRARTPFSWHSDAELAEWRDNLYPSPPARPPETIVHRCYSPHTGEPRERVKRIPGYTPPDPRIVVANRRTRW